MRSASRDSLRDVEWKLYDFVSRHFLATVRCSHGNNTYKHICFSVNPCMLHASLPLFMDNHGPTKKLTKKAHINILCVISVVSRLQVQVH